MAQVRLCDFQGEPSKAMPSVWFLGDPGATGSHVINGGTMKEWNILQLEKRIINLIDSLLQMVSAAMKLKDAYSLEDKL